MTHEAGLKAMPALEIEEVRTIEALEKLRPDWCALWARCPTATPFQSPEWLIPWWRHVGEGELWTLALRYRRNLVGLARWKKNSGRLRMSACHFVPSPPRDGYRSVIDDRR